MHDMNNNPPLLKAEGLKKYFPISKKGGKEVIVKAVDNVNFQIMPGETLGLVGESGCGKSTTGQMILDLLVPTEGKIIFEGKDITKMRRKEIRRLRRQIQIIFQDPFSSLNPRMTVEKIVGEPLVIHGIAKGKALREQVIELLETVGLGEDHLNRYPHEFSGGQRQRIGIARALALKPKLIVCDEPISALDVSIQAQILNLLKRLQQKFDLTYLFIAHGLPALKHISDRVAVMYLGQIVEVADKDTLFDHPMHPYTQCLISSIPVPDPEQRKQRSVIEGEIPDPANPPKGCRFHTRCPFAQEICKQEEPVLKQQQDHHLVACHFPK